MSFTTRALLFGIHITAPDFGCPYNKSSTVWDPKSVPDLWTLPSLSLLLSWAVHCMKRSLYFTSFLTATRTLRCHSFCTSTRWLACLLSLSLSLSLSPLCFSPHTDNSHAPLKHEASALLCFSDPVRARIPSEFHTTPGSWLKLLLPKGPEFVWK